MPPRMPARVTAGIALVALGLVLWALYKLAEGHEAHSYGSGGSPPAEVTLQVGHTYWLAVPGGVATLDHDQVDPTTLQCHAVGATAGDAQLQTVDEQDGTNAVNQIASFVAPVDGRFRVTCDGFPAATQLYVDNTSGDPSGWLIVAGVLALSIGAPLLLSGARALSLLPRAERPAAQPA